MAKIRIYDIAVPADLYPRTKQPTEKDVEHLIGADFPPITVGSLCEPDHEADGLVVLIDGAHRMLAAQLDGLDEIEVDDVGTVTARDVLALAIEHNARHGRQLSQKDKQRLARIYIAEGMDQAEVEHVLAVPTRTMTRWVSEIKEASKVKDYARAKRLIDAGASISAAAKEVGASRSTLQGWLKNPPKKAERPKSASPCAADDDDGPLDTAPAAEATGDARINSLVEIVVSFAKDTATALEGEAAEGEYYPHWTEIAEAAIERIRATYPKAWKVKS